MEEENDEDNEEEIINDNNNFIGIEEILLDNKINGDEIFRR